MNLRDETGNWWKVGVNSNGELTSAPALGRIQPETSSPIGTRRTFVAAETDNALVGANTFTGEVALGSLKNGSSVLHLPNFPGTLAIAPWFDIRWYGGTGDGVTDNTAALNAAIAAAEPVGGTILFPVGKFRFASKPNAMGTGIMLKGAGSVGSNEAYGTALVADYTETTATAGFLTWDGHYSIGFGGTGGGVRDLQLYKGNGKTGGTALVLTGADDNHRAGYMSFHNVVVSHVGTGTWNKSLYIDGSNCTTSGGQGIRDIVLNGMWLASSSDGDTSVLFKNAVHVLMNNVEIYPAGAGLTAGLTISGNGSGTAASTDIQASNCVIYGNVTCDYASEVVWFSDITSNLTITANATDCVFAGRVGSAVSNSSASTTCFTNQVITGPRATFNGDTLVKGRFGLGETASAAAFYLQGTYAEGTTQFGFTVNPTIGATATAAGYGGSINVTSAPNSATPSLYGLYVGNGSKGAGASHTNYYGLYLQGGSAAATNKWALYEEGTDANYLGGPLTVAGGVSTPSITGDAVNQFAKAPRTVPASATATGTAGDWAFDASYLYLCVATNTWKRVAISTW